MHCPICGAALMPADSVCPLCGTPVSVSEPEPSFVPPPPPSRCSRLFLVVISLTIIAAFMALGFWLFSRLLPVSTPDESPGIVTTDGAFILRDGVLSFYPEKYRGSRVLVVPDSIDGQAVTAIGESCFAGCSQITTIYLPEGITTIYPNAFAGCSALRGLRLPESTVYIGAEAFSGCVALESIYIPLGMNAIASGVFDDCPGLFYIFYSGFHSEWSRLYPDYVTPFTYVICNDGEYPQGIG